MTDEDALTKLLADWSKHGVRFAASCGERYSGVWLAVSGGSEFYLGARDVFGTIKISLHKTGECRFAITKGHIEHMVNQGFASPSARALHVWRRPTDLRLTAPLVVHLIFPTDHLHCDRPIGKHNKKVLLFEGRAGKAVEFMFFYSQTCTPMLEREFGHFGKPIFRTELANGECGSMVAREAEFNSSDLLRRIELRPVTMHGAFSENEIGPNSKLNVILLNAPSDREPLQATEIGGVGVSRDLCKEDQSMTGKNRIMIHDPKEDGTYVVSSGPPRATRWQSRFREQKCTAGSQHE